MYSNQTHHINFLYKLKFWYAPVLLIGGIVTGFGIWEQMKIHLTWLHYLVLFGLLISASIYDLNERIIPNRLIITGLGLGLIFFFTGALNWFVSLQAALGVFLLLQGIRWISSVYFNSPGIGMGDVKLVFIIALFLAWNVFWILYLAIMSAGIVAMTGLLFGWIDRKTRLPFAPFITWAAAAGQLFLPWEMVGGWLV